VRPNQPLLRWDDEIVVALLLGTEAVGVVGRVRRFASIGVRELRTRRPTERSPIHALRTAGAAPRAGVIFCRP
jgi:hypothetical protein